MRNLKQFAIAKCLIFWAKAYKKAQENPRLLIENAHSEETTDECVRRMKRLRFAEKLIGIFRGRKNLPSELSSFFEGRTAGQLACDDCWETSGPMPHIECEVLIAIYFASEKNLFKYASQLN